MIFARHCWDTMELTVLGFHADCLKTLNRKAEYVRVVMDMISKRVDISNRPGYEDFSSNATKKSRAIGIISMDTSELLKDLVSYSAQLSYDFTAPLQNFFSIVHLDSNITLFADHDGFKLSLELCQRLMRTLLVDAVKARLVDANDRRGKEVWLQSDGSCHINQRTTRIWLTSNVRSQYKSLPAPLIF